MNHVITPAFIQTLAHLCIIGATLTVITWAIHRATRWALYTTRCLIRDQWRERITFWIPKTQAAKDRLCAFAGHRWSRGWHTHRMACYRCKLEAPHSYTATEAGDPIVWFRRLKRDNGGRSWKREREWLMQKLAEEKVTPYTDKED